MHGKINIRVFRTFLMLWNHIASSSEPHNSWTVRDISYLSTVLKRRDYRLSDNAHINDISVWNYLFWAIKWCDASPTPIWNHNQPNLQILVWNLGSKLILAQWVQPKSNKTPLYKWHFKVYGNLTVDENQTFSQKWLISHTASHYGSLIPRFTPNTIMYLQSTQYLLCFDP